MDMKNILAKLGEIDAPQAEEKEMLSEAIMVQADGEEAISLIGLLKSAGIAQHAVAPEAPAADCGCGMAEEDEDPVYSNSPNEVNLEPADSGDDMHRVKKSYPVAAGGDNPMAVEDEIIKLEGKLKKMFESMSIDETDVKKK